MDRAFRRGFAGIFNGLYKKMMKKSELVKWNLMHGMYAYDAPDPVGYVKKIREFTMKGIGDKITQDMLIIGGRDDHMIMPKLFHEEYDLLPNVRSLAFQLYTDQDDAGSHRRYSYTQFQSDCRLGVLWHPRSKVHGCSG